MFRKFWVPLIQPIRRWIRNRTRPMSYDEAMEKKEFLAKLYMISAIGLFTTVCYVTISQDFDSIGDKNMPRNLVLLDRMNISGNVRHIKMEGFKKTEDYIFDSDALREEYRKKEISEQDENKSSDFDHA